MDRQYVGRPYVYLKLAAQPLDIRFDYLEPFRPKPKGEQKGHIQFSIQIADRSYGPFMTAYRCTPLQWERRKVDNPSLEAKRVRTRLRDFAKRLTESWKSYSGTKEPITADMLFERGTFTKVQLVEGGRIYVF